MLGSSPKLQHTSPITMGSPCGSAERPVGLGGKETFIYPSTLDGAGCSDREWCLWQRGISQRDDVPAMDAGFCWDGGRGDGVLDIVACSFIGSVTL